MGSSTSALTTEELNQIYEDTKFDSREIQKLYQRFVKLDRKKQGYITTAEFQLIPEFAMNPLCTRIIALFDKDRSDQFNFARFVETLAIFTDKASPAEKFELAFKVYDVDGDGKISEMDLFSVLKLLVGSNIDEDQLLAITKQTMKQADKDKDGVMNLKEFGEVLGEQVKSMFTIKDMVAKDKL